MKRIGKMERGRKLKEGKREYSEPEICLLTL